MQFVFLGLTGKVCGSVFAISVIQFKMVLNRCIMRPSLWTNTNLPSWLWMMVISGVQELCGTSVMTADCVELMCSFFFLFFFFSFFFL